MKRTSRVLLAIVCTASVAGLGLALLHSRGTVAAPANAVASSTSFPDATNTGVPAGTALSPYTGPCTITVPDTVIVAKVIDCDLVVQASRLDIEKSSVKGRVVSSTPGASVTIVDSLVDGGRQETFPSVSFQNITLLRAEVIGGQHSVQCWSNCVIQDSWLHDQYLDRGSAGHVNAFISNGGSNLRLVHNTLYCSVAPTSVGGGCTADASLFGDFGPISNITFDGNLFAANSTGAGYCLQAGFNPGKAFPTAMRVTVVNNVFDRGPNGKCGIYGPATAFQSQGTGNVWLDNTWSDGASLSP